MISVLLCIMMISPGFMRWNTKDPRTVRCYSEEINPISEKKIEYFLKEESHSAISLAANGSDNLPSFMEEDENVRDIIVYSASNLPEDALNAMKEAYENEKSPVSKEVLKQLLENADIASLTKKSLKIFN